MRERYPTRQLNGQWQVLVVNDEDRWLDCGNQEEAMLLSQSMILCQEVAEGTRSGHDVAEKLEHAAKVMERYIGPNTTAANLLHAGAANALRQ